MSIQLIFHRKDSKGMEFFPIAGALLLIQCASLATRSYFASEALFFTAIAALLAFVGVNLVFLGILLQEAVRGILRYARKTQPAIARQREPYPEDRGQARFGLVVRREL